MILLCDIRVIYQTRRRVKQGEGEARISGNSVNGGWCSGLAWWSAAPSRRRGGIAGILFYPGSLVRFPSFEGKKKSEQRGADFLILSRDPAISTAATGRPSKPKLTCRSVPSRRRTLALKVYNHEGPLDVPQIAPSSVIKSRPRPQGHRRGAPCLCHQRDTLTPRSLGAADGQGGAFLADNPLKNRIGRISGFRDASHACG